MGRVYRRYRIKNINKLNKTIMKKYYILFIVLIILNITNAQNWTAVSGGTNNVVRTLNVYNGNLIVGGDFISAGGVSVNQIAQWNDTTWGSMSSIPNVNAVYSTVIYNNELYASGGMGFAKWNGSGWTSIYQGSWVYALTIYNNELYYAKGGIIQKLNNSTSITIGIASSTVTMMDVYKGELIVGGHFTDIDGIPFNNIAKWNGTDWSSLGVGILMGSPSSMDTYNGELYVGGNFKTSGGNVDNFIQKWNGTTWSSLTSNVDSSVSVIDSIDGKLYVGGSFANAGSVSANHIASWDGSSWSALGTGLNGSPFAIEKYNGSIYAGGYFTMAGGILALNIAEWDMTSEIAETKFNDFGFKLYPNPVAPQMLIETKQEYMNALLYIYNLNGQEILKQQITNAKTSIDISGLTCGIYFAKLITDQTQEVRKIIKE